MSNTKWLTRNKTYCVEEPCSDLADGEGFVGNITGNLYLREDGYCERITHPAVIVNVDSAQETGMIHLDDGSYLPRTEEEIRSIKQNFRDFINRYYSPQRTPQQHADLPALGLRGNQKRKLYIGCVVDVIEAHYAGKHTVYWCPALKDYFCDTELRFLNVIGG